MFSTINQIVNAFRTYNSQILSGENVKRLSDKNFSDMVSTDKSNKEAESGSSSSYTEGVDTVNNNKIKHSLNDESKTVVQVVRDDSGKIVRTIPLNEQRLVDLFE